MIESLVNAMMDDIVITHDDYAECSYFLRNEEAREVKTVLQMSIGRKRDQYQETWHDQLMNQLNSLFKKRHKNIKSWHHNLRVPIKMSTNRRSVVNK